MAITLEKSLMNPNKNKGQNGHGKKNIKRLKMLKCFKICRFMYGSNVGGYIRGTERNHRQSNLCTLLFLPNRIACFSDDIHKTNMTFVAFSPPSLLFCPHF
jgi:hypothetical protein